VRTGSELNPHELRVMLESLVSTLRLTPRLLDVFFELAVGRSASEIADSLGISKQTAETEIKLLFRRLDVSGHRAVRSIAMAMLLDLARDNAPPPRRRSASHEGVAPCARAT
jgi:DNA-binding CsgD family transcriptional regulator